MSDGRVVRFPSLGQEALYKRIAAHVRGLIENRELQPGERLPPERDLARMLGVSRIPVREAMRTLADHRRIVAAIAAADPVEAGGAMQDHLDRGEAAALAGIDGLDASREGE